MAEIRVKDKNGIVHVFPAGSTPQQIAAAMGAKVQGEESDEQQSTLASPYASDADASNFYSSLPSKAAEIGKTVLANAKNPETVGGVVGGAVGGVAGGPGGAVVGAAVGGGAGRAVKQLIEARKGNIQPSSSAAAEDILGGAVTQGAYELGGQVFNWLGKLIAPASKAAKLGYAGDLSLGKQTIEGLMPELSKTVKMSGKPFGGTVADLENLVQDTLSRQETEYGLALQPIAGQQTIPVNVAQAIRAKIPTNLNTEANRAMAAALDKRALEFETNTWSIRDLDKERSDLAKRLRGYHNAAPSDSAAMLRLNADKIADQAANQALNDMLYPAADQAAGKAPGYFEDLKKQQSLLTTAKDDIVARKQKLESLANYQEGAPVLEKIHTHGYTHPTSGHMGATGSINPSKIIDPLKAANAAAGAAFPTTAGEVIRGVRNGISLPLSAQGGVNTLPLRYLFDDYDKPKEKTPGQQKKELSDIQKKYTH